MSHPRIRTDTEVCPYLTNNDCTMQMVWHDLHHIQFSAWVMFLGFIPRLANHPASILLSAAWPAYSTGLYTRT